MTFNKDIITRVVLGILFFGFTLRVLVPFFLDYLKNKMSSNNENDIDAMIRRQKEKLRSQYGVTSREASSTQNTEAVTPSKEIEKLYQETQWGGGEFVKEIQNEVAKNYSYKMAESKINAFILLCEKRNYLKHLNAENKGNTHSIKNYLFAVLLLFMLMEETREKQFYILEKIAKSLAVSPHELALALQIKLLSLVAAKKGLKEERIYTEALVLNQYSEETMSEAIDLLMKKEGNLWAKNPSLFFEEMTLSLSYASMLIPLPKLKNRKDVEGAFVIIGLPADSSLEEIKKAYKKIALQKHPDKILSQKLPRGLEQKAIAKFNQIQEAYEVLVASKK